MSADQWIAQDKAAAQRNRKLALSLRASGSRDGYDVTLEAFRRSGIWFHYVVRMYVHKQGTKIGSSWKEFHSRDKAVLCFENMMRDNKLNMTGD